MGMGGFQAGELGEVVVELDGAAGFPLLQSAVAGPPETGGLQRSPGAVVFNLPGSKGYRADLPWVMKIRWDGQLAAEVFVYVDDGRATRPMEFLAWQAGQAYSAGCTRRGVQDALRKWTSPSQTPGPWAGTVTHTDQDQVCGMVSQEKWDKTQVLIRELDGMLARDLLPLQRLLEIRGFLIYVVRTYPWLNPYIKGLHLTVDSWRPGQEASGFKLRGEELERAMAVWTASRGLPCRREDEDGLEEASPTPQRTQTQGHQNQPSHRPIPPEGGAAGTDWRYARPYIQREGRPALSIGAPKGTRPPVRRRISSSHAN